LTRVSEEILPWVKEALELPIAFAQVREDAFLDLRILERLGRKLSVFMVASGGCTAAALMASGRVARLRLVDRNAAQIALSRLKLHWLKTAPVAERLQLLGHAPMRVAARNARLRADLAALDLAENALGPLDSVAETGPDYAGRYERVFAQLRAAFRDQLPALADLMRLRDPGEQHDRVAPETRLGGTMDAAFEEAMALPNLIRLFGKEATNNRIESFSHHFARRTRAALAKWPAAENPYLWQVLQGRFPEHAVAPWLAARIPRQMPVLEWTTACVDEALSGSAPGETHFVHLSNILDWLPMEQARRTLAHAWAALRRGGCVFIRQLNSTLDIPGLDPRFKWQTGEATRLHAADRSFFYRALHLGRKP
jgi:S-adenosylmethionine-diacylglycerol 3-amino-3-carboxypropyl transferase